MKNGILLLTTKQNFVWTSMQEIIPFIESSWEEYAKNSKINYDVANVDDLSLKDIFLKAMNCKKIIITAFNANIAQAMIAIRTKFHLDTEFVFYLHGFSSLGCWPLAEWEMSNFFTSKDCFISTASRDVKQFKLSSDHKVFQIPFAIDPNTCKQDEIDSEINRFYYVGRISEQKNLHTLLYAFYLSKEASPDLAMTLDIFGKYDELGSPNMGLAGDSYDKYIKQLIIDLKLEDDVILHGFVNRELIQDTIKPGKRIFVTSSLHSDENFGMAVLKALMSGHQTLLSDWGGLSDFANHFPNQTHYVDTSMTKFGPMICPHEISKAMSKICHTNIKHISTELPHYYSMDNILNSLNEVYNYEVEKTEMQFNSYPKELAANRTKFANAIDDENLAKFSCKIYESYSDINAIKLMACYATNEIRKSDFTGVKEFRLPPWVKITKSTIEINDPHRGKRIINNEVTLDQAVKLFNGDKIDISKESLKSLWDKAYAFDCEIL